MDEGPTFIHIFEKLMSRCDILELELVAIMAWKFWFRRNGLVCGGDFTHHQQIFQEMSTSIEDFGRVAGTNMTERSFIHTGPIALWQLLPIGLYKVNWNVALDKKHGRIGYFLIIRDFEEIVLVARSTTRNFLVTPEVAEVLTALYNVETCKEMGFYDIILGGDALYIVQAIKAIRNNWSN
jgi:hypothetical protein